MAVLTLRLVRVVTAIGVSIMLVSIVGYLHKSKTEADRLHDSLNSLICD